MIALLAALTLAAAEPTAVEGVQVPAPPANETRKERDRRLRLEAQNKIVCRDVILTGTNMHNQVCKPQGQWDAERRIAQRAATRYQQEGMRSLMPGAH